MHMSYHEKINDYHRRVVTASKYLAGAYTQDDLMKKFL